MSLWNNIKDWFTKEKPQQKPEQPAGEAAQVVEGQSVEELFFEICVSNGLRAREARKSGLVEEFIKWYTGDQNRKSILQSLDSFIENNEVAKRKITGTWK
tara:strand:+ start:520 stop:819 length:300 start_codon:yes stop_codon:yes gene_type:complete